jgi:heme/copper-type cytochrome/quinol oxidase subunit 2
MEFSYRISEAEYLRGARPKSKGSSSYIKAILFWLVIIAFLVLLLTVVQHFTHQPSVTQQPAIQPVSAHHTASQYFSALSPLLAIVAIWILASKVQPMILRRRYRKDFSMQGQFTVNITPESISIENTAGASSQSKWNDFRFWYEADAFIVLVAALLQEAF